MLITLHHGLRYILVCPAPQNKCSFICGYTLSFSYHNMVSLSGSAALINVCCRRLDDHYYLIINLVLLLNIIISCCFRRILSLFYYHRHHWPYSNTLRYQVRRFWSRFNYTIFLIILESYSIKFRKFSIYHAAVINSKYDVGLTSAIANNH